MPKGVAGNVRTHFPPDSGRLASAPPMTSTCTFRFPAARGLAALPRLCTNETTSSLPGISKKEKLRFVQGLRWIKQRKKCIRILGGPGFVRAISTGRFKDMSGTTCSRGRDEARPSPRKAHRGALPRDHVLDRLRGGRQGKSVVGRTMEKRGTIVLSSRLGNKTKCIDGSGRGVVKKQPEESVYTTRRSSP